ncbi:hypothetical protein ACFYV5_26020 [Streptomyces sp. NPDC003035]|uniref:hypothetical protein n=1 Tax=Streptomyces sp. NPDC003035 TaxID=3364676 RepID=UPI0036B21C1B
MRPTTPYRPLDITVPFPELTAYARTATLLHPRAGAPTASDSSVGGPLLWPADEAWPMCAEHGRVLGVRPERARQCERIVEAAWARPRPDGSDGVPYTDAERAELDEMSWSGHQPDRHDGSPLPLLALAQLHARDVPDLAPFAPPGTDLLQVLWCPFRGHEDASFGDYGPSTRLYWRRAADVIEPLSEQPEPAIVERKEFLPNPCVLFPEQVVEYPYADCLPRELVERIDAWEDAFEERLGAAAPCYQYDLSLAPGWKIGGWDSWHRTDLVRVYCGACGTEMRLLLTIDSFGGARSWLPYDEAREVRDDTRPPSLYGPTGISAARDDYRAFACPTDPRHPHRMSSQ